MREKGFVLLVIIGLIAVAALVLIGAHMYLKNKLNPNNIPNNSNLVSNLPSVSPTVTPISAQDQLTLPILNKDEINKELETVFKGQVEYKMKNGEVPTFDWNDSTSFSLTVYLYTPGKSRFPSGYEGFHWERDLDKDVQQFLALKPGKQGAMFYETIGEGSNMETTLKQIGQRNYAVVDSFFPPAGNWDRIYYTYDQKTHQLVYLYFSFYNIRQLVKSSSDEKKKYSYDIQYPEVVNNFLKNEEEEILALH